MPFTLILPLGTSNESLCLLYTLLLGLLSPLKAEQTSSLCLSSHSLLQPFDHLGILHLLPHANIFLPCINVLLEKSWKQYSSCSITSVG